MMTCLKARPHGAQCSLGSFGSLASSLSSLEFRELGSTFPFALCAPLWALEGRQTPSCLPTRSRDPKEQMGLMGEPHARAVA